jgi:hypothetical protein
LFNHFDFIETHVPSGGLLPFSLLLLGPQRRQFGAPDAFEELAVVMRCRCRLLVGRYFVETLL